MTSCSFDNNQLSPSFYLEFRECEDSVKYCTFIWFAEIEIYYFVTSNCISHTEKAIFIVEPLQRPFKIAENSMNKLKTFIYFYSIDVCIYLAFQNNNKISIAIKLGTVFLLFSSDQLGNTYCSLTRYPYSRFMNEFVSHNGKNIFENMSRQTECVHSSILRRRRRTKICYSIINIDTR